MPFDGHQTETSGLYKRYMISINVCLLASEEKGLETIDKISLIFVDSVFFIGPLLNTR